MRNHFGFRVEPVRRNELSRNLSCAERWDTSPTAGENRWRERGVAKDCARGEPILSRVGWLKLSVPHRPYGANTPDP